MKKREPIEGWTHKFAWRPRYVAGYLIWLRRYVENKAGKRSFAEDVLIERLGG